MGSRRSRLLLSWLLLAACSGQQSSAPVLESRFAVDAGSSFQDSVDVGVVPAGFDILEVTSSANVELTISVRTPSWYAFHNTWDALHRGACEQLDTGQQRCTAKIEHAEIPAGTWDVFVKNQSGIDADFTVRVIDGGSAWGLAGGIVAVIVLMFAGFFLWWWRSDPGRVDGEPGDLDPRESRERLDLLRAKSRVGPHIR